MIVFAAIIPIFNKTSNPINTASKTAKALEQISSDLQKVEPDVVIISSPTLEIYSPNLEKYLFSNSETEVIKLEKFENGTQNTKNELSTKKVKVANYYTDYESPSWHYRLGNQIVADLPDEIKIAWIAIGELSSRLNNNSPYGQDPSAGEYDHKFIQLLSENRIEELVYIEPDLTEAAAENGLRSCSMLFGALANYSYQPKILSYEGPEGRGLLVAKFENIS